MFHTEDVKDLVLVDYTPMRLLYCVRNHAVRDGDFKKWLSDAGIDVPKNASEKKLKQRYPPENATVLGGEQSGCHS